MIVVALIVVTFISVQAYENGNHLQAILVPVFLLGPIAAVMLFRQFRKPARDQPVADAEEPRPWSKRKDWRERRIKGGARAEAWIAGAFGGIFILVSAPAVFAIPEEMKRGNHWVLAALLFWLVGFAALFWALKRARQVWRHGVLVFEPEPMPGVVGGYMGGVIRIPKGARIMADVKLALQNVRTTQSGSGKNRRSHTTTIWETDAMVSPAALGKNSAGLVTLVPVLFHVSENSQPTERRSANETIGWKLTVNAPVGERSLETSFDVPVFDTGEIAPPPNPGETLLDGYRVKSDADALRQAGVVETGSAGSWVWVFQQKRVRRMGAAFGAIGLVIVATAVKAGGMIGLMVGGGGVLFLMFGHHLFWHRSELRTHGEEVVVTRRGWIGSKRWSFRRTDIGDLQLARSMESGNQRYLRLTLVGTEGVDPTVPHVAEHFHARKARYRWSRAVKGSAEDVSALKQVMAQTPRFELRIADYLAGNSAAEQVVARLKRALLDPAVS